MRFCLCTFLIVCVLSARAQTPSPTPSLNNNRGSSKTALAEEAVIFEEINTTATYEANGTGTYENVTRIHVQSSSGVENLGLLTFSYQKSFQEMTINYVRVRKPDGSLVNTSLDDIQDLESEVTREAPFYSDLREKHVAVKGLAPGNVLEYSSKARIFKALAPNHFWLAYNFSKNVIIRDEQFRLSVPKDLFLTVKSRDPQPQTQIENGRKIYLWKRSQLERPPEDLKEKYTRAFHQHGSDIQISTFKSWQEVGDWYDSLQRDRVTPSAEIRAKALELTKDAKNEEEKLHILYDFVSTRFRYIGVAFGIGRYQPHSASDVLENSYGDCKDKHTLLAALLESIGIHSSPALIGTTLELDADVPSPGQFDHVITAVHRESDLTWLDTTSEVAPFGLLLPAIRGKNALLVEPDRRSRLAMTPAEPPFPSIIEATVTGKLSEDGEFKGSFTQRYRGDVEIVLRSTFHRVPQPQWKDLVQQMSNNLGYGGTVSDVVASNPDKTSEPFEFSYSYDRKDYADWVNNKRITPPLPPIGVFSLTEEYEKSGQPIELGAPTAIKYVADITLPRGYTPVIPKNTDATMDFAEYQATYSLENGVLHASRSMKTLVEEVPASQYAKYREFDRKIDDDIGTWITFTSGTSTKSKSEEASGTEPLISLPDIVSLPDTEAGHAYQEAIGLLQSDRTDDAMPKLEHAAKLDPKLPRIWDIIGVTRGMKRDLEGAIENLQRQTRETPDDEGAWRVLSITLLRNKREQQAIPVLQKWVEIAPKNGEAAANLGNTLIALKRHKEALAAMEKATELNPDSASIHFSLGNAFMASGEPEKGFQQYSKAIDLAQDAASFKNDAAYMLATKKVHLDEAEDWVTDAIRVRDQESLEIIDLDHLDLKHIHLMSGLAACWDTLGYIYYLRGDYEHAEPYLRSSFDLLQAPAAAEHLGDVYQELHQPAKAIRYYSLAANSLKPSEDAQDKLFRLQEAGVSEPPKWQPREEFGRMRTVKLPQITKQSTSAEFMVMLSNQTDSPTPPPHNVSKLSNGTVMVEIKRSGSRIGKAGSGKVEQVKFLSGAEQLRNADKLLRGKDLLTEFPDDTLTRIFRRGVLVCSPYITGCQFTLLTSDSVYSAN